MMILGQVGKRRAVHALLALALLAMLAGCGPAWQATVQKPDGSSFVVDKSVLKDIGESVEADQKEPVSLELVLAAAGHRAVEWLFVVAPDGSRRQFDWAAVADSAVWLDDGQLLVDGTQLPVTRVEVQAPVEMAQVQADLTDLAPTAAAALGLPVPASATGQVLAPGSADHVLLLYLDGFGYVRYQQALMEGLVPTLAALPEPLVGLTVYPPATNTATAAVLTGAPPEVNGVNRRGVRTTEAETLFDVAAAAGQHVVAVEGDSLAFNLRNAQIQLSGDRDANGSTDDNVLANALAVLDGGMPELLWVHFHGIDDAGHTYGPRAAEEAAAVAFEDGAVGEILGQVPDGTLVMIFADHGMHHVVEEGRAGNHAHLTESDIFVPVWIVSK
jgi:hypothetical protein